jgi:hypothetical protein
MFKKPTPEESIQSYISIIDKYYGDVLKKFGFKFKSADVITIIYENDCFTFEFGFEFNQWGYMLYCGIGIGVKKTQKEYWVGHIVRALMKDEGFDFEKAAEACIAQSPRGMLDFEAHRIVWDPYIVDTFKHCAPTWEKAIEAFGKSMGAIEN